MRIRRLPLVPLAFVALALTVGGALAQNAAAPARTSDVDRLFLSFVEDATVVSDQWWEGRAEYAEGDTLDVTGVRGIVAFGPWDDLEVGGRVGFASSDTEVGLPDGSGATDLDLWAKYYLGRQRTQATEFAVGSLLTVPIGDDTAGLGFDAFSGSIFGSLRRDLQRAIFSAHAGLRFNGDGKFLGGGTLDGEIAPQLGFGLIIPVADRISLVGEADYEGERFDGGESDTRLLGGVNWRVSNRGIVRGATAFGLSDGAPDFELRIGYAVNF